MATYINDLADPTATNCPNNAGLQHEDFDVPLVINSDSYDCDFYNFKMNEASCHSSERKQLVLATSLCFIFMITEIIGGYLAGSLAIMTDAAHLLSDCISFIVALISISLAKRKPNHRMSFGYKRAEVLGAIFSIFGIWILTLGLLYFAIMRVLNRDFEIDTNTMMAVSAIGVLINIIMAIILHGNGLCTGHHNHSHGHKHQSQKSNDETCRNNNKPHLTATSPNDTTDMKYKILQNFNSEHGLPQTIIGNSRAALGRSNSICSYRSPSHSRTNSFSRVISNNDAAARRSSYSNNVSKWKSITVTMHRDSFDSEITRTLIEPRSLNYRQLVDKGLNAIGTDSSICPTHNLIRRDSSDNISESTEEISYQHHSNNLSTKSINIQAAVIHVIGDLIQSIGVFTSAIIIKFYPEAKIVDPICTFVFSIIVIFTTITIMKDSIMIILEGVPNTVNIATLSEELSCINGVRSIHNLNVWSLTTGFNIMSAHIVVDQFTNMEETLITATTLARQSFDIMHSTIQIERAQITSDPTDYDQNGIDHLI